MTARAAQGGLLAPAAPRYYSIDAGRPFLHDLANAIAATTGFADPLALADTEILLPTRRAARALNEAFISLAPGGRASILPRIRPIGDVEEDEIALAADGDIPIEDLPPAVSPLERRLVLARFIAAADRGFFDGQENWPAAIAAAQELSGLLDSFYTEEVPFERLRELAPPEHAAHWQRTLEFLRIVTEQWPAYLDAAGRMDPAARRARLIRLEAERLAGRRPTHPIIIAGSTGSAPSVARLMQTVACLEKGAVVLPGLDRALANDRRAWDAIEDPHPQAGLKALLERLGVAPRDVRELPAASRAPDTGRARLISLALRPAEATDDWRAEIEAAAADDPGLKSACEGLTLIEAADEEAEAGAIAVLMRETLETPARTGMLVTPDRNLARRVAAKMRRWNVTVDDSGGAPFGVSPCGSYLRLVADWLAAPDDPHTILSLAKAPLAGFGLDAGERSRAVEALDLALRGLAPREGIAGVRAKVAEAREALRTRAEPLVTALEEAYRSWARHREGGEFADLLDSHITAAETLASNDRESGATRLWRGEDGEAGALLIADLRDKAEALGRLAHDDYARSFAQIIASAVVRRRRSAHPRLLILGPLEARLQSADLVILGGLNEGAWPADAMLDPFLSRAMRAGLGLPSPERRIGLAAHDFAQGASAPRVALTRSARSGGAPAKPSRWLVRLKNILGGAGALDAVDKSAQFAAWTRALDAPDSVAPVEPPRPAPSFDRRPRSLSVTRIEKWLRDPYSIFARYILGLRKLDPLAERFSSRHLGMLLHKVFEEAVKQNASRSQLDELLSAFASDYGLEALERAFWTPAIEASFNWFAAYHAERRAQGRPIVLEETGAAMLAAAAAPFEITARADRIDLLASGDAYLIDYKSGRIPTAKQIRVFDLQLPLTAHIVEAGGFPALGAARVGGFSYVKTLNRKDDADESGADGGDAREIIVKAHDGLLGWIETFDKEETPYLSQPRPQFTDDYGDYDHLARRREWLVGGEG